jgi:hypothetical protein
MIDGVHLFDPLSLAARTAQKYRSEKCFPHDMHNLLNIKAKFDPTRLMTEFLILLYLPSFAEWFGETALRVSAGTGSVSRLTSPRLAAWRGNFLLSGLAADANWLSDFR